MAWFGRLAITLLAPLAVYLIGRVPLPWFQVDELARTVGDSFDPSTFGLFCTGLVPVVDGFLLVEVAALIVPRWRALRYGSPGGRARLDRAALVAASVLSLTQSFFIYRWLQGSERAYAMLPGIVVLPHGALARLAAGFAPAIGPFVLLGVARLVSRYGLGNGIAVLLVGAEAPHLVSSVAAALTRAASDHRAAGLALLAVMFAAGLIVVTARPAARGWDSQPPAPDLPTPASSTWPLTMALFVADTPTRLASFTQSQTIRGLAAALAPGTAMHSAVLLAVLAIGSVLLTWVLARPALMAPVWERALATDDGSADAAQALARQAFRRAIGRALAWLGAAGVATIMAGEAGLAITSVALVALGCVGVDIVAELRFRRVHAAGGMAIGWPMHRLYAVGPVLARLARAGIPAFPRGLRYRTLLSFWGPYVPIEILVPPARASEARALAGDGLVFDADASRGSPHPPSPARG